MRYNCAAPLPVDAGLQSMICTQWIPCCLHVVQQDTLNSCVRNVRLARLDVDPRGTHNSYAHVDSGPRDSRDACIGCYRQVPIHHQRTVCISRHVNCQRMCLQGSKDRTGVCASCHPEISRADNLCTRDHSRAHPYHSAVSYNCCALHCASHAPRTQNTLFVPTLAAQNARDMGRNCHPPCGCPHAHAPPHIHGTSALPDTYPHRTCALHTFAKLDHQYSASLRTASTMLHLKH